MRRKNKLLVTIVGVVVLLGVLGVSSMNASAAFVSPTQLSDDDYDGEWVNLEGSVQNLDTQGQRATFEVTDGNHSTRVVYEGTLPETMGENRIVVAKGRVEGDTLVAKQLSVRAHEGSERPAEAR
ncbi:cytochrome c maturation protein CcmE domain-containing protein [Haloplanus aerogenes]|uniref:Cytochrome c maturation protein CcmE n=1 Tax=Haloplanus aerogenes TaxID=660522 RepID=A0A3M0DFL8_9EURY|nr:cytochrome c maturation protein CcmE [Haloplanus aerogenes]AZH26367.1 cytochrome c maturation protein CcmE [Haloplanus aerogenes]RMB18169.1 cytochrome c-type biogenesis protein CcmE [Haloplanus aerogenes]